MPSFAQNVCSKLRFNNIKFQIYEGYDEKENMVLNNGDEFIQIMKYDDTFLLSWAMPMNKAIRYIQLVDKVEFDVKSGINKNQDTYRFSSNLSNYHDTGEYGHLCIALYEDLLWHLVVAEENDINEKWITKQIVGFKMKMDKIG